jgi:hypothetical protein
MAPPLENPATYAARVGLESLDDVLPDLTDELGHHPAARCRRRVADRSPTRVDLDRSP